MPNAIRVTPTSVTTAATSHLPVLRQRPSGTSVYSTPMRIAVMKATCIDGSAQPPQLARRSTPNGRGRRAMVARIVMRMAPSCTATSQTSRCRQRRRTNNPSSSPEYSVYSIHQEPMLASPAGASPVPTRAARPAS